MLMDFNPNWEKLMVVFIRFTLFYSFKWMCISWAVCLVNDELLCLFGKIWWVILFMIGCWLFDGWLDRPVTWLNGSFVFLKDGRYGQEGSPDGRSLEGGSLAAIYSYIDIL